MLAGRLMGEFQRFIYAFASTKISLHNCILSLSSQTDKFLQADGEDPASRLGRKEGGVYPFFRTAP